MMSAVVLGMTWLGDTLWALRDILSWGVMVSYLWPCHVMWWLSRRWSRCPECCLSVLEQWCLSRPTASQRHQQMTVRLRQLVTRQHSETVSSCRWTASVALWSLTTVTLCPPGLWLTYLLTCLLTYLVWQQLFEHLLFLIDMISVWFYLNIWSHLLTLVLMMVNVVCGKISLMFRMIMAKYISVGCIVFLYIIVWFIYFLCWLYILLRHNKWWWWWSRWWLRFA